LTSNKTIPFLELKDIKKTFPGVVALDNVDFDLLPGEIHALVGENGAGKTTLVNLLNGSLTPDEGKILLKEEEVEISSPKLAKTIGISTVHQELKLVPNLSVAENIFLGRQTGNNFFMNWKDLFKRAEKILNKLDIEINPKEKVKNLSIAKQQQVEIAKAISIESNILILDEPTASLTEDECESLFQFMRNLLKEDISIIYISHRIEEIIRCADRITVLRDGKKIDTLEGEFNKDLIVNLMTGKNKNISNFNRTNKTNKDIAMEVNNIQVEDILSDISFKLHKGEILGIAGLVGSGRTEMLKTLFGLMPLSSGEIKIKDKKMEILSPEKAIDAGLAYIPEDRKDEGLILEMNVKENSVFANLDKYSDYGFMKLSVEKKEVKKLVKRLNIKITSIKQKTLNLSGGNQQKVVFAKWLLADRDIFLLDEPTRGIDVGAKKEIFKIIYELANSGKSIIFVSSEIEEVVDISDRIVAIHKGKIIKRFSNKPDVYTVKKYITGG